MGLSRSGRRAAIVTGSVLFHAGLLAILALQKSTLRPSATPPPTFDVTIVPFYEVVAPTPQATRPRPVYHPRVANRAEPPFTPPIPAPPSFGAPPAAPPAAPASGPSLGDILRRGMGCRDPQLAGLSASQKEKCLELLGAGARTASYAGQGLARGKQAEFDAAAQAQERYRKYREAPLPPGLSTSDAAGGIAGLGESRPTNDHRF